MDSPSMAYPRELLHPIKNLQRLYNNQRSYILLEGISVNRPTRTRLDPPRAAPNPNFHLPSHVLISTQPIPLFPLFSPCRRIGSSEINSLRLSTGEVLSQENTNRLFEYGQVHSARIDGSLGDSDGAKENFKKWLRSESCGATSSKACREKLHRDRLNDKFLELGDILEPGKPPKTDKAAALIQATRFVAKHRN
ncbi:hypothetical protein SAY87_005091 [Trapa incisa]|uniref:BHLH domain-containing protein n=1 Tax=Trapa incisa TaxID=236973 RepID=A0AAN7PNZ3_9MYRT|nr:hypothetical protein SAY87_005091 [Trapa incisa]